MYKTISEYKYEIESTIWADEVAYGIPFYIYLPLLLTVFAAVFTGNLPDDMVGATAFLLAVAGITVYIGDRLPIWRTWFGGGLVLCLVLGLVINYYALIPAESYQSVESFLTEGSNMLDWFIAALIAGSILSMPRSYLVRALPIYAPSVIGGLVFAAVTVYVAGAVLGFGGLDSILTVLIPVFGGGMGAGGIPLSEIYASETGTNFEQMFSIIAPAIILGNMVGILFAAVAHRIGTMRPSLSGDGVVMPEEKWKPDAGIETPDVSLTEETIVMGWVIAMGLLLLGYILATWIPIHPFAIMILLTIGIKVSGVFPVKLEEGAGHFYNFMVAGFVGPLLLAIGMALIDIQVLVEMLNPVYFALVIFAVTGGAIGAAFVGYLFGMFPIEAALCGGLCMVNMGGSGDVATLAAAERMELMAFAQMSSRIGGALMLLIGQTAISLWGTALV
ncbi:2-hydroxycarboxylate transporter family protein [Natronococcus wangiae]|uniref:2-hydroxycarboxylate transporter family protein n=1 Tax=Natronococcus wangiae TaxID=3068275 RepID=UPI00273D6DCB|nr:2-hydroxycarboxylate transporter family protein [Natronococcus sp. AD5]